MFQIVYEFMLRKDVNFVYGPFLVTHDKYNKHKKWCIFHEQDSFQDKKSQERLKFVPNWGITQTARCTVCPANVFCKRSRKKSCKVPSKLVFKLYILFHVLSIHCKRDSFL